MYTYSYAHAFTHMHTHTCIHILPTLPSGTARVWMLTPASASGAHLLRTGWVGSPDHQPDPLRLQHPVLQPHICSHCSLGYWPQHGHSGDPLMTDRDSEWPELSLGNICEDKAKSFSSPRPPTSTPRVSFPSPCLCSQYCLLGSPFTARLPPAADVHCGL